MLIQTISFAVAYVLPILIVTVICKTVCANDLPERSVYRTLNSLQCEQLQDESDDVADELEATKRKLNDANREIFKLHQALIKAGLE